MFKRGLVASVILGFTFFVLGLTLTPASALAASKDHCEDPSPISFLSIPTWYKYLDPKFDDATQECKFTKPVDANGNLIITQAIGPILLAVTEILLRVGTYLAIGVIVWGGIQYQISQGEPERTKNARSMIINAVVGLVIAIFATAIVNLVGRNVF